MRAAAGASAFQRFEREAADCARVQHEKTVLVYDYGVQIAPRHACQGV